MDAASGLALFNAIATAGKNIYEIAQGVSKLETKQQLMDVYDTLMNLKMQASSLEDDNRNLREKLRFKSDDFEFRMPFYYEKTVPNRPLCPKCFSKQIVAPMGEAYPATGIWRRCLVCDAGVQVSQRGGAGDGYNPGGDGNSWML